MKAVVIHETGGPEVLRIEDAERPEPGQGEVLIRVRAASVNPVDWKHRRAMNPAELPAILGTDMSGTVEVSRAAGFAERDDVFGFAGTGAYAEYTTSHASVIATKPAGLSHEQAAAIPVAGLTAWQALFDYAGLEQGQTALIAGAAGGVGHFAVQFARHAGARTTGTGSTRNRDFVLSLGAEQYVDYTQQAVAEAVSGVDVALDTVGGDNPLSLLPALREGGILLTIASAPPVDEAQRRGVRTELVQVGPDPEQLARIAELVAAGEVRVELSEVLDLEDVARAHQMSESGHTHGKIVLRVG